MCACPSCHSLGADRDDQEGQGGQAAAGTVGAAGWRAPGPSRAAAGWQGGRLCWACAAQRERRLTSQPQSTHCQSGVRAPPPHRASAGQQRRSERSSRCGQPASSARPHADCSWQPAACCPTVCPRDICGAVQGRAGLHELLNQRSLRHAAWRAAPAALTPTAPQLRLHGMQCLPGTGKPPPGSAGCPRAAPPSQSPCS